MSNFGDFDVPVVNFPTGNQVTKMVQYRIHLMDSYDQPISAKMQEDIHSLMNKFVNNE